MHRVLGKARDATLWVGRHFRGTDMGRLAQHGDGAEYLRVSKAMPGPLSRVQQAWKAMFRHPELAPKPRVFVTRGELGPQRVPPILGFLTIKLHGAIITQGTEEEGLNIKEHGEDVVTGGTGSITVKEHGA